MSSNRVRMLMLLGLYACTQAEAGKPDAKQSAGAAKPTVSVDALGGGERYLAHLSTDKPIYRIGETVYFRGVVLEARNHKPLDYGQLGSQVEIKGPKGDTVASGPAYGESNAPGTIGFSWVVPEGQAGGEYTAVMRFAQNGLPPTERKFDVRVFRAPRLNSQIVFLRDGYGPGDHVTATLHTERAEGGIPANAKVTVTARIDDVETYRGEVRVDARGNATASFDLPVSIARGDGTLAMAIEDGGVVETATKTLPILLQSLDLAMFPEGGDLVVGVPSRVYVEARTPTKKPADLEAVVVDETDRQVATCRTEHEGRGRFTFTPEAGRRYTLKVTAPAGIKTSYPLPLAVERGAVLSTVADVVGRGEPVRFKVGASFAGTFALTVTQRGADVGAANVEVSKGGWLSRGTKVGELGDVTVQLPGDVDGVLTATLWDENNKPLAERLFFRQPAGGLNVAVKLDRETYAPGGQAKIEITTTNAAGKPVSAFVGMTVSDESVIEMVEKREQAPRLPVMVYLESDVRELADAHVYLDAQNPKAPLAVDLLLGTQGWRRFALVNFQKFLAEHGDQARRALAVRTPPPPPMAFEEAAGAAMAPMAAPAPGRHGAPKAGAGRQNGVEEDFGAVLKKEAPRKVEPPRGRPQAGPANRPMAAPAEERARRPMNKAADKNVAPVLQAAGGAMALRDQRMELDAEEPPQGGALAYVREYAHQVRAERKPNDRVDFSETLYWSAALKTDANGKASVAFGLGDSVTSFRVSADAYSTGGDLGSATSTLKAVTPFYVEPKVPLQLTAGDVIDLPLAFVNATSANLSDARYSVAAAQAMRIASGQGTLAVNANSRVRRVVRVETQGFVGTSELVVSANAGNYSDKVTRTLDVRPVGFPVEVSAGGMLAANETQSVPVTIANDVAPGSMQTEALVFPTPLGNLTQALTRLMQEPNGCFEQTSSTSYPLTMAQEYFTSHQGVDPAIVTKSGEILTRGYARLTSFECKDKGYEWFGGQSPGHEALTAYGLMQFGDMARAKLRFVDTAMVQRTRDWLLKRRNGKGGFERNQRALDSFGGAPDATTNAYITWSLLESGERGLDKEVEAAKSAARASNDTYVVALGANVAALAGDKAGASELMKKLVGKQDANGAMSGAVTSITRSGGEALQIEVTSLAVLAWLRDPAYAGSVEKAMRYLSAVCQGGRFASTQSTVLALKAIIAYDAARARPKANGAIQLLVDGKPVGAPVPFTSSTEGTITLPVFTDRLSAGKHVVALAMQKGGAMPYAVTIRYNTPTPASSAETKLSLSTTLRDSRVREGDVTEMRVDVTNVSKDAAASPVAIIGIPGGLEVRHDQLKELVKRGSIAAYEVLGREVVLYWRQLKADEKSTLPISVVAAVPGRYTAPASRAYEYYTDEHKRWVAGTAVEITPVQ